MDGLISNLTFKCKMCNIKREITSEDSGGNRMGLNVANVMAMLSLGCGHSEMVQQHAILNIPQMSYRQYAKYTESVTDMICETLWDSIEEAGKEELRLAEELGDVDSDGYGLITVITDGAWSKRSYRANYAASSGVACIVGAKTGKILFLATRNKYCPICAKAQSRNETVKSHICSKNWQGSSTSMEADIIVEGFKRSIEMHRLKYVQLVGDGDSSVYKKITVEKPYGPNVLVKKVECSNHLLRNYCSKLRDLTVKRISSRGKVVSPLLRKRLSSNIERIRIGIKKAIVYRIQEEVPLNLQLEKLIEDIKNSPYHVFGQHSTCANYFCSGPKEGEVNFVPSLQECGLMDDIISSGNRLTQNAYSLLLNMNNNAAETYNSVVAKFVGGKRINFAVKSSYDTRCKAAAVAFNKQEKYFHAIHKKLTSISPGKHSKKYMEQQENKKRKRKSRRELFPVFKKKRTAAPADSDYGLVEEVQVISDADKKTFLNSLTKSAEDIIHIENVTRGQISNPLWREYRNNLLTASNFGLVCKLRKTTDHKKVARRLLTSSFCGSTATRWGQDHEEIAKMEFSRTYQVNVQNCGLFIWKENPFLGASPDGVIDDDSIIEVKCPYSALKLSPDEAIQQGKIKYMKLEQGVARLKTTHNFYYQVQGQLAISRKKYCYFVIWTPLGLSVDKIVADEDFWHAMLLKLKTFYEDYMLPEILSS